MSQDTHHYLSHTVPFEERRWRDGTNIGLLTWTLREGFFYFLRVPRILIEIPRLPFISRSDVVSLKRTLTILFIFSFTLPIFSVLAQTNGADLDAAVAWLKVQQVEDGGFSNGFAPESDIGATADTVLAMMFAGEDPTVITTGGKSPINFLEEQVQAGNVKGAGVVAKVVLAVNAVEMDPRSFAGMDLVHAVVDDFDASVGLFGLGPFDSGLAILALVAVNEELPKGAVEGLLATRLEDGSFSFSVDPNLETGDSNTTAIVVQALIAAATEDEIGPSLEYFRATQNEDDGWTYQKPSEFGEETDANSTAFVIQALDAAGENLEDWGDPMTALASLQLESGAFGYSASFPEANILATIQAIPTLASGTYVDPVAPVEPPASPGTTLVIVVLVVVILVLGGAYMITRVRNRD